MSLVNPCKTQESRIVATLWPMVGIGLDSVGKSSAHLKAGWFGFSGNVFCSNTLLVGKAAEAAVLVDVTLRR